MLGQTYFFKCFFTRKTSSSTITYSLVDSWKGQWIDSEQLCLQAGKCTFETPLGTLRSLGHPEDALKDYQMSRKATNIVNQTFITTDILNLNKKYYVCLLSVLCYMIYQSCLYNQCLIYYFINLEACLYNFYLIVISLQFMIHYQ